MLAALVCINNGYCVTVGRRGPDVTRRWAGLMESTTVLTGPNVPIFLEVEQ